MKQPAAQADSVTPAFVKIKRRWRMLLVVAAAVVLAANFIVSIIIERRISAMLLERFAVPAEIGDVDVSLLKGTIIVSDVRIANPPGFANPNALEVGEIHANFSYRFDQLRISELRIRSLHAFAERDGDKRQSIRLLLKPDEDDDEDDVDDEYGDDDEKKDEEELPLVIDRLIIEDFSLLTQNNEKGRHSGFAKLSLDSLEAHEIKLIEGKEPTIGSLYAAGLRLEGPGNHPDRTVASLESIEMPASKFSALVVHSPVVSVSWRENGESNLKRIERVIEAVWEEEKSDEDEREETPKRETADKSRKDKPKQESKLVSSLEVVDGTLILSAQKNGEWEKHVYPSVSISTFKQKSGWHLRVSTSDDKSASMESSLLVNLGSIMLNINARQFPLHPILWGFEAGQDDDYPRVHRALLDSRVSFSVHNGRVWGNAEVQFHDVKSDVDTRPFWKRINDGGTLAMTLNEMVPREGESSQPVRFVLDEDVSSSSPLVLMMLFKRRFHEARARGDASL